MIALFQIVLISIFSASASTPLDKAHRDAGVSYKKYLNKVKERTRGKIYQTPISMAVSVSELDTSKVVKWKSISELTSGFIQTRDLRYLFAWDPNFSRRNSWLYPDDGCFARSALLNSNLQQWNFIVPNKIFVFGDLNVKTKNNPNGEVDWWYHVVPIVRVGNQPYVLDPAIDPMTPMKLKDWLNSMTRDIDSITVAICASGTYGPSSDCSTELVGYDEDAQSDQTRYLNSEWSRLEDLGRDPIRELGDEPPWATANVLNVTVPLRHR